MAKVVGKLCNKALASTAVQLVRHGGGIGATVNGKLPENLEESRE